MKIASFETKYYELNDFDRARDYGFEKSLFEERLTEETLSFVNGHQAVTTLGFSDLSAPVLKQLSERGVRYLATRTVGYDHIDVAAARQYGIRVSHSFYEAYNVADFTVMLMLMLLRKAKVSVCRALVNDFSLDGMCGREMHSLTIGIIGAGKIGRAVIGNLSGFGCKILVHDPYISQNSITGAKFVDLDTLYRESDIVSLHIPFTESNRHLINSNTISKMKTGVLIVNTARGELIQTQDLIAALESGKVGGAGLDTIEAEKGIAHVDLRARIVDRRDLFYLKQFPNVIFTSHYAFFTEEATSAMVECALKSFSLWENGKENPYEIKA